LYISLNKVREAFVICPGSLSKKSAIPFIKSLSEVMLDTIGFFEGDGGIEAASALSEVTNEVDSTANGTTATFGFRTDRLRRASA